MRELIGSEVNIDGEEGEITNVLGVGYEIAFFYSESITCNIHNNYGINQNDKKGLHLWM